MVGNQLEQEILGLYNKEITALYSINEIAHRLNKAYPYINKKVSSLIESNVLTKTVRGKSHLCSINLESDEATWLLILNDIRQHKDECQKEKKSTEICEWIKELKKVITLHLAIKSKKKLIFVVEKKEDKEILERSATQKSIKIEVFSKRDFQNLLLDDKNILEEHVILHGYEKYYHYLREIEQQLRIRYA